MKKPMEVGTVVYSVAGRDEGRFFVVTEVVNSDYVKIADGDLRRIDTPKLKKTKHLKPQDEALEKIKQKLVDGQKIFDAELKSALRPYN
jgi:ribosomal protein L14E/L6E/L27E